MKCQILTSYITGPLTLIIEHESESNGKLRISILEIRSNTSDAESDFVLYLEQCFCFSVVLRKFIH